MSDMVTTSSIIVKAERPVKDERMVKAERRAEGSGGGFCKIRSSGEAGNRSAFRGLGGKSFPSVGKECLGLVSPGER